jgi:aryl-alcohol dehydrogenase-like predicted oxidoreductase
MCLQYEAFFNGICEAIDPDYEFAYDRMMTDGDESCHWAIRRKAGRAPIEAPSTPSDDEDMLKALKWRLTRGEITLEQYQQLRAVLLEK